MVRMPEVEGEDYSAAAFDALGTDDPAEVQAGEVATWHRLLEAAGAHLRSRPAEGEWSVIECLGHMVDSELIASVRYRMILAEHEPAPLHSWSREAWMHKFDHTRDEPSLLLEILGSLRRANIALWHRTLPQDRSRTGMHDERGLQSYEQLFRQQAGHGRLHHAQAERALGEVRRARMLGLPPAPDREG